jgi:hypothetical protein
MLGPVLGEEAGSNDTDGFVLGRTDGLILSDGTKLGCFDAVSALLGPVDGS